MIYTRPHQIVVGPLAVLIDWWARKRKRPAYLGDGSDGPALLDGRKVPWAELTGNTYLMTRDIQVTMLWVHPKWSLVTNGWRIQCRGTIWASVRL